MSSGQVNGVRPGALSMEHCDLDINPVTRTVTFRQKSSRLAIVQDRVTVPIWTLKQLVGLLTKLEGAGEQGGALGAAGSFDAASRTVTTLVRLPGAQDGEAMAAAALPAAPYKVLAGILLEREAEEEAAGRFTPAMAIPQEAAAGGPGPSSNQQH